MCVHVCGYVRLFRHSLQNLSPHIHLRYLTTAFNIYYFATPVGCVVLQFNFLLNDYHEMHHDLLMQYCCIFHITIYNDICRTSDLKNILFHRKYCRHKVGAACTCICNVITGWSDHLIGLSPNVLALLLVPDNIKHL